MISSALGRLRTFVALGVARSLRPASRNPDQARGFHAWPFVCSTGSIKNDTYACQDSPARESIYARRLYAAPSHLCTV
jgi:hypothetical protein